MSRSKRVIAAALLVVLALVIALTRHASEQPAKRATRAAERRVPADPTPREEIKPPAATAVVPPPAPAAAPTAAAALDAPTTQEQKQVLARDAEAGRIAARERKLAALDWDAPRPGPPPADRRVPVSKKEAELTVEEKLEKTERMTQALQERVRRTQQAVDTAARSGQADGAQVMLLARLQARVSELEETSQALRGQGTGPVPSGAGQPSAPSPETTQ